MGKESKISREVRVSPGGGKGSITGDLEIPAGAEAVIVFAHGSGSSRFSARNRYVAKVLNEKRLGTLLFDLLTEEEEKIDAYTAEYRFDIELLAERLASVTDWLAKDAATKGLKIGYFGASTGAAAALEAAASRSGVVYAVVSRGGRPDLAAKSLPLVKAPVLLIVGGEDFQVIELNEFAMKAIKSKKKMEIIPGATHLFEEPGALEKVARLAADWFLENL